MDDVTVLGAGVAGLWAAFTLSRAGLAVRLIDRHGGPGPHGCSWWAGGMLAPFCEGAVAEPAVVDHGRAAAAAWAGVTKVIHRGSLVVALARDRAELERFARRTEGHRQVTDLRALEPELAGIRQALFFEDEAHLDPRRALADLVAALDAPGVTVETAEATPEQIPGAVIDARGLGAGLPGLRGVRGEMAVLHARDIRLTRPLRLLHPRHPLYIVPRADGQYMLGTAQYPSPAALEAAFRASGASVATVSLRREAGQGQAFWEIIRGLGVRVLPNTAGCHSAVEAITTARMVRELFDTPWIKLEVIGHADTLQPDPFGLVEAAGVLAAEGFEVFAYTTEDQVVAARLIDAGCRVLMPWGAPIGTGLGLNNPYGLRTLRPAVPDIPMVIDAGLGLPSHAAQAMEMGFDAVLLNTAVAQAGDPVAMARAFALAADAGRLAHMADPMPPRDMAAPSTPVPGKAWL